MSIYINGRFLTQRLTGVHRFAFEMCKAMMRMGADITVIAPQNVLDSYKCEFKIVKIGKTSGHLWEQIELPLYMRKHHKNELLISFSGLGPVFRKNHISTIHDLAFIVNPAWYSRTYTLYYKLMTPILVRNAKKIITVSNYSKKEISRIYPIVSDKIHVIYNALSDKFKTCETEEVATIDEDYVLAVSSMDPRKNFPRLVDAFMQLENLPYKLYIIGGKPNNFGDMKFSKYREDKVKFLGYVSDNELVEYYKKASLFVYPSLFEGFGIPPLEAMSQGTPVLLSDIEVLREVCGDVAFYCNPYDINDIAEKIEYILSNKSEVIDKRKGYSALLSKYSWDESAEKLLENI